MESNKKNTIFLLLLAAIVLIYTFTGGSIGIYPDFGEDSLTVSASSWDWTIPYDQIASLELAQLPDKGTMRDGIDKAKLQCGDWENDTWGSYTLCVVPKVEACIVVTQIDGSIFVMNYESEESTAELYNMFTQLLQSKGISLAP